MIILFSGTGNLRLVAQELSESLGDSIFDLSVPGASIADVPVPVNTDDSRDIDRVIWIFPIYSWGVPKPVEEAIRQCPSDRVGQKHYMVTTCGDDAGLADHQWQRLISHRNWQACGAATVIMPNTYTMMKGFDVDPQELAQEKLMAMPSRVRYITGLIGSGKSFTDVTRGKFAWFKTKVIYPWFIRYATVTKPFHVTDACISCGLCARNCPINCIVMDAPGIPHWIRKQCAMCERCYHQCPRRAIRYGKQTDAKGQYLAPNRSEPRMG